MFFFVLASVKGNELTETEVMRYKECNSTASQEKQELEHPVSVEQNIQLIFKTAKKQTTKLCLQNFEKLRIYTVLC